MLLPSPFKGELGGAGCKIHASGVGKIRLAAKCRLDPTLSPSYRLKVEERESFFPFFGTISVDGMRFSSMLHIHFFSIAKRYVLRLTEGGTQW